MAMTIEKGEGGIIIWHRESRPRFYVRGHVFTPPARGQSQEERLWEIVRNPALLNDLEAEIALVHYDPAEKKLSLIRDAFGQSPLFYSPVPGGLAWSFTLPGLLNLLPSPPPADEKTVFDYLATHYRHIFRDPERTFHQNVFQAPAGSAVIFKDGRKKIAPWLDLSLTPDFSMSPDEASFHFLDILKENTRWRWALMAEEKAAATISSGLDSSTVASLVAEESQPGLTLYSVGYEGGDLGPYDETSGIEAIVGHRKSWNWKHLRLTGLNLIDDVSALTEKCRAPLITVTWLAYYHLARKAADDGFKRLFTGLGGDECLAGEFEHFFYFFADLKKEGREELLARETAGWQRLHDHPVFKKNPEILSRYFQENIDFKSGAMRVQESRRQANWEYFDQGWVKALAEEPPMPRPYESFLANRLYQEIKFETTPPTLWAESASSRAAGLCASYPFLSPRLVRFALSTPGPYKYEDGLTKTLLRRALKGLLPEGPRWNPVKTGFNAPFHQWLKDGQNEIKEVIKSGPALENGWLSDKSLERVFQEHLLGRKNHMMLLWPLLCFSLWKAN